MRAESETRKQEKQFRVAPVEIALWSIVIPQSGHRCMCRRNIDDSAVTGNPCRVAEVQWQLPTSREDIGNPISSCKIVSDHLIPGNCKL